MSMPLSFLKGCSEWYQPIFFWWAPEEESMKESNNWPGIIIRAQDQGHGSQVSEYFKRGQQYMHNITETAKCSLYSPNKEWPSLQQF